MTPVMYQISKQKCYGNIADKIYTLKITQHCETKRYTRDINGELRQIESLALKHINYIVINSFHKFKDVGKYVIVVSDIMNKNRKHYIVVAYEKLTYSNTLSWTVVTMMSSNTIIAFKKIPIKNRLYFEESLQTIVNNSNITHHCHTVESIQKHFAMKTVPPLKAYVPGLLQKYNYKSINRTGLKIVKKKVDISI